MVGLPRKRIYVFEQVPRLRTALEAALAPTEVLISGFSKPRRCLERLATRPCDLLILSLEGGESEGLDLLEQARRTAPWIPSLVIVEQAAVGSAVKAIKAGARDCLDMGGDPSLLLAAVRTQLAQVDPAASRRHRALTPMEIRILHMILAGRTSHEIAHALNRSKRTIDVHRKNIMRKLLATDLVDLIKRALSMGFGEDLEAELSEPEDLTEGERTDEPPAPSDTA